MNRFTVAELPLDGLKRLERQRIGDNRGFLSRLFCMEELYSAGWIKPIVQINHTCTASRGTVRGMHFQNQPGSEMKIVICIKGEVYDVAVDLRSGSETFLNWHGEILSADNCRALLIPEGFAHGFQTLTHDVELIYLHSAAYDPVTESGVNPFDPSLSIGWPLAVELISDRDKNLPLIDDETFKGI